MNNKAAVWMLFSLEAGRWEPQYSSVSLDTVCEERDSYIDSGDYHSTQLRIERIYDSEGNSLEDALNRVISELNPT